jgi:hypothetical protein
VSFLFFCFFFSFFFYSSFFVGLCCEVASKQASK